MNLTNNQKVTLPSGAELEMTMLPFTEGRKLYKAAVRALKSVHLDIDKDIKDINLIKDGFIEISTNEEIEKEIFNALKDAHTTTKEYSHGTSSMTLTGEQTIL